jgi:hypothetical protein
MEELKNILQGSPATMRLLVIDACRSGSVTRVKGVQPAPLFDMRLSNEITTEGLAIVTSSAAGEASQESDELRGSFFSHHLVNALRGAADQDGDGRVTLSEAYAYTYAQTLRSSGQTLSLQHPTYAWDVKGRGEFVLAEAEESKGRLGRLRLADASVYLVSEKREGGALVAEVSPPAPRATLQLAAGSYFVQRRGANEFQEFQVDVPLGGEVDLADLPSREVRYDRLVRKRGGDLSSVASFSLLGGGRGAMLGGEGPAGQLVVSGGFDGAWGSLSLRVRGMQHAQADSPVNATHRELGVGLVVQRFVDLDVLSLSFGLVVEGVQHHQTFDTAREAPARTTWGGGFGGLVSAERHLAEGLALRLEGGPTSGVFSQAVVTNGLETSSVVATPLTWWFAGGLVWRH